MGFIMVGSYNPETEEINREFFRQGYIVKDENAFLVYPNKVCYIPELSDTKYTRIDFIEMCKGNVDFAEAIFYEVGWQHPETLIEEALRYGEWVECENCNKFYDAEEFDVCPMCGTVELLEGMEA